MGKGTKVMKGGATGNEHAMVEEPKPITLPYEAEGTRTVIDAARDMARETMALGGEPVLHSGQVLPLIMVAGGVQAVNVEKFLSAPRRIVESVSVNTFDSFVRYWKRFSRTGSLLRLNVARRTAQGVLDYHACDGAPAWCDHVVTLPVTLGKRLTVWRGTLGAAMSQETFSTLIEDNLRDIMQPAAADLLESVLSISVSRKMTFGSSVRLASGERSYSFRDENDAPVTIPERIILSVPLFDMPGSSPVPVELRVRYRLVDGKLTLFLRAPEMDRQIDEAVLALFESLAEKVVEASADALVIYEP